MIEWMLLGLGGGCALYLLYRIACEIQGVKEELERFNDNHERALAEDGYGVD